jgi:hypothetical protein
MTKSDFIQILERKYYALSADITVEKESSKLKEIELKQNFLYELLDEVKKNE